MSDSCFGNRFVKTAATAATLDRQKCICVEGPLPGSRDAAGEARSESRDWPETMGIRRGQKSLLHRKVSRRGQKSFPKGFPKGRAAGSQEARQTTTCRPGGRESGGRQPRLHAGHAGRQARQAGRPGGMQARRHAGQVACRLGSRQARQQAGRLP